MLTVVLESMHDYFDMLWLCNIAEFYNTYLIVSMSIRRFTLRVCQVSDFITAVRLHYVFMFSR